MANKKQQESLDVAEDSREKDWIYPSFTAELFKGNFNWNLINPFPLQTYEDKHIGDLFIKKLDKCLKENINPHEVDKNGQVPKKALEELAKIGTFGIKIPKKYGGLGMSISNYNRIMAHVGKYCSSTAVWLSAHQSIGVPEPLLHFGNKEQKEKFLPELARGAISAFALTEPGVGSDPANMKTTAIPTEDGKHYILNGEKMWITNGPDAKYIIVMAKTPSIIVDGEKKKQITAFILDTNQKGFSVSHKCSFMGIRGISNGLLKFDNIKIPVENIIGKTGEGLKIAFVTLNTGRLSIPSISTGTAKECLKYLRKWTNERIQWGIPIGKHEAVSDMLFEMNCNTFAMESITKFTSALADKGNADIRLEAAMAKYFASETTWKILDDALQIRGGRGFENEESLRLRGETPFPIERMFRDARINRIIEGTSQVMRLFIAREAMDTHMKLIIPIIDPKTKINEKIKFSVKAGGFYTLWYPKQWLRNIKSYDNKYLNEKNKNYLIYIEKTSKKLARTLFHTMGKYQQKLEREEKLMEYLVDIGTNLFAMSATLSYAQALNKNERNESAQELAEGFCYITEQKIKTCFKNLHIKNKKRKQITEKYMKGDFDWLEK